MHFDLLVHKVDTLALIQAQIFGTGTEIKPPLPMGLKSAALDIFKMQNDIFLIKKTPPPPKKKRILTDGITK